MYVLLNYGEIILRSKRFQSSYCAKGRVACSKRSDSGERCEVKIAIKSRGGLRTAPHYLNAWNRLKVEREQKKKNDGRGRGRGEEETFFSLPLPRHSFFCSRPNFSRRTRAETLATQARRNRIILIQRFIIVAVLIIN